MQTDRKPVGICVDHFGRSTIRRQHAAGQKRPTAERTLSPAQPSTRGLPLTLAIRELQWGRIRAFCRDFYKAYLHKNMRLGDFLLEADAETPGRVVRRFFSDNTNYVVGRQALSEPIDPSQFEAKSYEALIASEGANALDSRGGGIEIQTDEPLELARNVEEAIIPSSQARSRIGKQLQNAGVEVIPYRLLGRMRPNEFTGTIYERCVDYLCRKELVDEARL
jgi:hypothetical protein